MKVINTYFLLILIVLSSLPVYSVWDGSVTGKIDQIHVTGANNYGFRIYLEGKPKLCGNDHNWAYLNGSDSNYDVYVSTLLAAKMANTTVRILTNRKDNASDGYCHIGYIYLLD